MKYLLFLLAIGLPLATHAQRALQVNPNTHALIESFGTGGKVITVNTEGGLSWEAGASLTGASDFRTSAGLGNVENTALSTWAGTANITTIGTLSAGAIPTTLLTGTITNAQLAGSIDLTTKVTGTLPVANGGTGLTALGSALQVLRTNAAGTALEFATISSGLTIGSTTITSGTDGRILYDNAGVVGELPTTGSDNVVRATSPTITTGSFSGTQTMAKTGPTESAPILKLVGYGGALTIYDDDGTSVRVSVNGNRLYMNGSLLNTNQTICLGDEADAGLALGSSAPISFSATSAWWGTKDTVLTRAAAGILKLAHGTTTSPASLQIWGTLTGSKYLSLGHDGTSGVISASSGGVAIGTRGSAISAIATVVKSACDPASIAAGATETTTATITGCASGSTYIPSPIYHAGLIISADRTGTDTVTITIYNPTTGAIDAGAVDIRVTEVAF